MGEFIVSARKYRPNNFETLIGQDNIARTLKNSIAKGKLAHAYLFCGPRGVGKTSTARIFAKTINCLHPTENLEPCGECESCRSFDEGRSFSIHELDAASNNSVDDIRNLIDQVRIPPQIGKYSVYIIDEVHMLSSAAFNAFLKTLEEPPAHAIFILATTEKHKIIPTILSRCQTYDFNRISVEDAMKNLRMIAEKENIKVEENALLVLAQKADGAMRDALTLFDQAVAFCGSELKYADVIRNLNVLDYEYYFRITDLMLEGNYIDTLIIFDEILKKGFNALHFMGGLSSHFRNLMVAANPRSRYLMELPESLAARYIEQSSRCSAKMLYQALGISTQCEADYRQSANQRLHIEFTLIRLCRLNDTDETQTVHASVPATAVSVPVHRTVETQKQAVPASPVSPAVPETAVSVPQTAAESEQTVAPRQAEKEQPMSPAQQKREPETEEKAESAKEKAVPKKTSIKSKMSIKAMMEQVKASNADVSKEVETSEEKTVDNESLQKAWQEMASEEKAPRLASTLAENPPTLMEDGTTVQFMVSNIVQKNWMEQKCLLRLNHFLRNKLENKNINIEIHVKPVEEATEGKLYTAQEKSRFMIENNPQLRELTKKLDLELK